MSHDPENILNNIVAHAESDNKKSHNDDDQDDNLENRSNDYSIIVTPKNFDNNEYSKDYSIYWITIGKRATFSDAGTPLEKEINNATNTRYQFYLYCNYDKDYDNHYLNNCQYQIRL